MTTAALYTFLQTWISGVVTPVPVIRSHQNSPAPTGVYVVVGFSPSTARRIGQAQRLDPNATYVRKIANDYECVVEIREVNGVSDNLHAIINSVDRVDIRDLFRTNKVAYLGELGEITRVPELEDSTWRPEFMVEVRLGTVDEITDVPNAIETVELVNEIE